MISIMMLEPQRLIQNGPVYTSWSPDSRYILAHIQPFKELLLIDVQEDGSSQRVSRSMGSQLTPAWSPLENKMAFVETEENQDQSLFVVDAGAEGRKAQAKVEGSASILWSPNGKMIAVGSSGRGNPPFETVKLLSTDTMEEEVVLRDTALAFFWSPEGRRLAYVTWSDNTQSQLVWSILDVETKERKVLKRFQPTRETLDFLSFFDQFAKSHMIWSPDGRYIVFAGVLVAGATLASLGSQPASQIILIDTHGLESPRFIAEGVLAFWSQN